MYLAVIPTYTVLGSILGGAPLAVWEIYGSYIMWLHDPLYMFAWKNTELNHKTINCLQQQTKLVTVTHISISTIPTGTLLSSIRITSLPHSTHDLYTLWLITCSHLKKKEIISRALEINHCQAKHSYIIVVLTHCLKLSYYCFSLYTT